MSIIQFIVIAWATIVAGVGIGMAAIGEERTYKPTWGGAIVHLLLLWATIVAVTT